MRNDHTCSALRAANRPVPRRRDSSLVTPPGSSNLLSRCRLALLAGLLATTLGTRAAGEAAPSIDAAIGHVDAPAEGFISDPRGVVSGWSLS
jgi:hypothetical protein